MKIEPIPGEQTRWIVYSASRKDYAFIVDSDWYGKWACGCEQYMARGLECKHIRAVRQVAAAQYEPLVECELCHDLHDPFQMRVDAASHCYCDKCSG